jgi:GNAT superfamily N-acetyltransferase
MIMTSKNVTYREAMPEDIPGLHHIRLSVKENALSDPNLVKEEDYIPFLVSKGKGWLGMVDNTIIGFSIVDLENNNVWALFIHPDYEGNSVGKNLHKLMLDWYFQQTSKTIWLGTAPGTRAELFYRKRGWEEVGMHGKEIKFEMNAENWRRFGI